MRTTEKLIHGLTQCVMLPGEIELDVTFSAQGYLDEGNACLTSINDWEAYHTGPERKPFDNPTEAQEELLLALLIEGELSESDTIKFSD